MIPLFLYIYIIFCEVMLNMQKKKKQQQQQKNNKKNKKTFFIYIYILC